MQTRLPPSIPSAAGLPPRPLNTRTRMRGPRAGATSRVSLATQALNPASSNGAGTPKGHEGEAVRERFEGQFFKTKLCVFWEKGRCVRGSLCKYAHGAQELQAMPDLTNTAMCRMMAETGRCTRPNCLYAHSHESLRATENFYKTTMCSFFRYGRCRLGELCRHAHSENELRKEPEPEGPQGSSAKRSSEMEVGPNGRPMPDTSSSTSASGSVHGDFDDTTQSFGSNLHSREFGAGSTTEELDDDELPDIMWDRISTMPATVGQRVGESSMVRPRTSVESYTLDQYNHERMVGRSRMQERRRSMPSWADLQEEEEEDEPQQPPAPAPIRESQDDLFLANADIESLDEFDDVPDMWARMQTTPARMNGPQTSPFMMAPIVMQVPMMFVPVQHMGGGQAMMAGGAQAMMPGGAQTMMAMPATSVMCPDALVQQGGAAQVPAAAMMALPANGMDMGGVAPVCMQPQLQVSASTAACGPMGDKSYGEQ